MVFYILYILQFTRNMMKTMKIIQNITKNNFIYKHIQFIKKIIVNHNTIVHYNKNQPLLLGRWQVKKNDKIIDLMIDYANEDNCGTSSYYSPSTPPLYISFQSLSFLKNKEQQQKICEKPKDDRLLFWFLVYLLIHHF